MQNYMKTGVYSIEVPCRKHNLKRVRNFVENVLLSHLISPIEANLVVLAIDELCANLMIHSHHCKVEDSIEVKINTEDGQFTFEIYDYSPDSFNLLDYKTPDMQQVIKERKNGGIGLILVSKIMDKIQYEKKESYSVCRLRKSSLRSNIC
jgi:serine/threonine-protein kinase RsbW